MHGIAHIQSVFQQIKNQGRSALMPYFTLGYPNQEQSLAILTEIAQSGADLIELGVPFSDPLADGPTIQHSTQVALQQGASLARCLEMTAELRARGVHQPLILMGYYNPILAFGVERFVEQAARCGADGFIVPDLPPEEAGALQAACQTHNLALIYLLAPTSTPGADRPDRQTGFRLHLPRLADRCDRRPPGTGPGIASLHPAGAGCQRPAPGGRVRDLLAAFGRPGGRPGRRRDRRLCPDQRRG